MVRKHTLGTGLLARHVVPLRAGAIIMKPHLAYGVELEPHGSIRERVGH